MTTEQRTLLIWGAGALLVLIAAGIYLSSHAETLEQQSKKADSLYARYRELYPADGTPVAEATQAIKRLQDHQLQATTSAEKALVPDLPDAYGSQELHRAANQVNEDYNALRLRADRQKIRMIDSLPFKSGLDPDGEKRSLQMAQVYLFRQVLGLCMDAGVTKIESVKDGKAFADPSGTYAVITGEFDLVLSYQASGQLLGDLLANHDKGIGVRSFELEQAKDGSQHLRLVASLLTVNRSGWKLDVPGRRDAEPGKGQTHAKTGHLGG